MDLKRCQFINSKFWNDKEQSLFISTTIFFNVSSKKAPNVLHYIKNILQYIYKNNLLKVLPAYTILISINVPLANLIEMVVKKNLRGV